MKYVWEFRQAVKTTCYKEYSCYNYKVKPVFYSSLKKIRNKVKEVIESGKIKSANNWIKEDWSRDKSSCSVINSGGWEIFCWHKIEVK